MFTARYELWAISATDYISSLDVSYIRCLAQSFSFGETAAQLYVYTRKVLVTEVANMATFFISSFSFCSCAV